MAQDMQHLAYVRYNSACHKYKALGRFGGSDHET